MTEFLKNLWMKIFGTTEWLVIVMVVVFWAMKPKKKDNEDGAERTPSPKDDITQQ